jgi:hypothetical protein
LAGLLKFIAIGSEEAADCRLHPFALTAMVPAFSPFGVTVIEVVVLVPVQPEGNVQVKLVAPPTADMEYVLVETSEQFMLAGPVITEGVAIVLTIVATLLQLE